MAGSFIGAIPAMPDMPAMLGGNPPFSDGMAESDDDLDNSQEWFEHQAFFKRVADGLEVFPGSVRVFPSGLQTTGYKFAIKERYLLFRELERELIKMGGTIFGGYVRDMILHHHGAQSFFENVFGEQRSHYTDPSVHQSSFRDRNTYPRDIDFFVTDPTILQNVVEHLSREVSGVTVHEVPKASCYSHHPSFTNNFFCKRYVIEYVFNSSFQKGGDTIKIGLDAVINLKGENKGPWKFLVDLACNMLYLNSSGIHSALETTDDAFENISRLNTVIELTKNRVSFVPPMAVDFRVPSAEAETMNIRISRKCTEMQALSSYRNAKAGYRALYRMKYMQRIAKLVKDGWNISNLGLKFTLSSANLNGETFCAITHEELKDGDLIVQLGSRVPEWTQTSLGHALGHARDWTQTSVMTWPAFLQYVFSRSDDFSNKQNWAVLCPISKKEIDTTEFRPVKLVLGEALECLRSHQNPHDNVLQ